MQDLALYQKLGDLSDYLFPVVDRFPKREKFALCTQIKNCLHRAVCNTIRMQKSRDKRRWLYEVDIELEMLRHFVRHSHARRYLSNRRLKLITEKLAEVGRIIGGLLKRFSGARS